MNIAIRYFSKTGHTKEVAEVIAKTVEAQAEPVSVPIEEHVDLLFLGGAFYFMHEAKELREFIKSLDPAKIGAVAAFSTTGGPEDASKTIGKECREQGLNVLPEEYHVMAHDLKKPETEGQIKNFAQEAVDAVNA